MGQTEKDYGRVFDDLLFRGPDDPCRKAYESIVMIGGSEYRDQSPPSGKGRYLFESFDPCIESFGTDDSQELMRRIFGQLGCVRLVRMKENEWSVEDCENIFGTITEIVGENQSIPERLAESDVPERKNDTHRIVIEIVVTYRVQEASP